MKPTATQTCVCKISNAALSTHTFFCVVNSEKCTVDIGICIYIQNRIGPLGFFVKGSLAGWFRGW